MSSGIISKLGENDLSPNAVIRILFLDFVSLWVNLYALIKPE